MKQVFKIGSSEELNPSQAVLLLEVGETYCCFGIVDHATQTLLQSGYFTSEEKDNAGILQQVVDQHAELRSSFHQAVIGYYTPENILVPEKYYRYEETQSILQTLYDKGQHVMISESLSAWQLYNAYYVPAGVHEFISRHFTNGNFWHVYSAALKNEMEHQEGARLMVDFKTDSFSVILTQDNALLLAQIFTYTNKEDVLYYLLNICKQFSLSQNEIKLEVSGLIDRESNVYKELYQYFNRIGFASHQNGLKLSESFRDYPVHFFSSLFKLVSCAL